MARTTSQHAATLRAIADAAQHKLAAQANLERVAIESVRAGVPAVHVAEAAGVGRTTLYRWLDQETGQ